MEYEKIEEVRKYFIEKYGEPSEKKVNGYTYKTINQDLDCFNRFISAFTSCAEALKIDNIEKQINAICEFAKNSNPINLEIFAKKLERIEKEFHKGVGYSRKPFRTMIDEIGKMCQSKDFDPNCLTNLFSQYLKVKSVSYNIKAQKNFFYLISENREITK